MASEIRVNQIQNRSGLGTVTFSDTGVIISGITTISDLRTSGTSVVAAGTTAAPSISPTGDSNTGIFFPSADTIAFGEGGAEAARIDSSGRLLIGTTVQTYSSAEKLEVNGGYAAFINPSSTVAPIYVYNTDTTLSTNQPFITLSDSAGNRGAIGVNYSDTALWIHGQSGIRFRGNGTSPGTSEWARFDSSGNVGIGSTIPENKLDVNGTIKSYSGANKATFKDNQLRSDASGTFFFDHGTVSQSFTFRTSTSSSLDTTGPSITSAGNISFPSGKGIDFSATANSSGTMTSEIFDDYEKGTWTPRIGDSSNNLATANSANAGTYTKIGNRVLLTGRVQTSSVVGLTGASTAFVTGLPFSIVNTNGGRGGISVGYANNLATGGAYAVTGYGENGDTRISLVKFDGTTGVSALTVNQWSDDGDILFSFVYETT